MSDQTKASWAWVIAAAGPGSRLKADLPKPYLVFDQSKDKPRTLLQTTLERIASFRSGPHAAPIYISVDKQAYECFQPPLPDIKVGGVSQSIHLVQGGQSRAQSVAHAIEALWQNASSAFQAHGWVWVHDAARPCITHRTLEKLQALALKEPGLDGVVTSQFCYDTLYWLDRPTQAGKSLKGAQRLNRDQALLMQTPQAFRLAPLRLALKQCIEEGFEPTDELSAVWHAFPDASVAFVEGGFENIKVTDPSSLKAARALFQMQESNQTDNPG